MIFANPFAPTEQRNLPVLLGQASQRVSDAAGQLLALRISGMSDFDAMQEIAFNFTPILTAEEQKAAIAEANRISAAAEGAVVGPSPVIVPGEVPGEKPLPSEKKDHTKLFIGLGLGAVGLLGLIWLLRPRS